MQLTAKPRYLFLLHHGKKKSALGCTHFLASGLDINGCVLSYFRGQQMYTVIQAVHSLLYIVAKCHFFSVTTSKDIIKYLQKCKGVLTSVRYCIYLSFCLSVFLSMVLSVHHCIYHSTLSVYVYLLFYAHAWFCLSFVLSVLSAILFIFLPIYHSIILLHQFVYFISVSLCPCIVLCPTVMSIFNYVCHSVCSIFLLFYASFCVSFIPCIYCSVILLFYHCIYIYIYVFYNCLYFCIFYHSIHLWLSLYGSIYLLFYLSSPPTFYHVKSWGVTGS